MIIDIPSHTDFINEGIDFLNLAWYPVLSLAMNLEEAKEEEYGLDLGDVEVADYWKAAQRQLATVITLVMQGTEFILKGKIAETSPFLLIAGNPNEWPKRCDRQNTPFASFRTIDAQDLIRAHDAVANQRLSDKFKSQFEDLRQKRNTIMHTTDKQMRITVEDVLISILEISHHLIGPKQWLRLRRHFIEREPGSDMREPDNIQCDFAREVMQVVDILEPAIIKKHLGFDKRQRRYLCPECAAVCSDYLIEPNLAQLRPNESTSTNVYCILCESNRKVRRDRCKHLKCNSNVIDEEENICLVCGNEQ